MNSGDQKVLLNGLVTPQNKVKLNNLSKYIFQKICQNRQIWDLDLMKMMLAELGPVKEETLKRRKYDAMNILQKADIIFIQKKYGSFLYRMKHDVPNSIKDLENIQGQMNAKKQEIERKRDTIKMMQSALDNYRRLIELNQLRKKQEQTAIQLPAIAVTQNFMDFCTDCADSKQTIKLRFPAGSKFINNILAHSQILNF